MGKKYKKKSKFGFAPGTLVFTGVQKIEQSEITAIIYSQDYYDEKKINTIDELKNYLKKNISTDITKKASKNIPTIWINIDGVHDVKLIEELSLYLQIHKLTIEDILSVGQRAKIEIHSNYIHIVARVFDFEINKDSYNLVDNKLTQNSKVKLKNSNFNLKDSNEFNKTVEDEQFTVILKDKIILTFQEKKSELFNSLKKRIKEDIGAIRKRSSDYLLYAILDSIIDHYIVISEYFNDKLDSIEMELLDKIEKVKLERIYNIRKEIIQFKRSIYPIRDVVSLFEKIDEPTISNYIKVFIRDLYDHTIQVIESTDSHRETIYALLDLYMNRVSNKTNEIMKVLTVMSSIFIPLTFIAGVYGMNFDNMPELHFKYGYFVIIGFMISVFLFMLIYFRGKKWF